MRSPSRKHLPAGQVLRPECRQRQTSPPKNARINLFVTRHAQSCSTRQLDRVEAGVNDPSHLQFQNAVRALSTT